ncbi:MAG: OsmC family peroxiredoxin [Woeseiaceae bacterium]|nr:OsmC family peroxiredoxin [Woeseiaceae bacterium]
MQDFPHNYRAAADATHTGNVELSSEGVIAIQSAGPPEFGGPGDQWSPETLLVATVADCFILSFRAIARASKLDWTSLSCKVVGTLDRIDRTTRFTKFDVTAELLVPTGTDEAKSLRLLQKAEDACLITNSLIADSHLNATVQIDE